VVKVQGTSLDVEIKAKPEKNQANEALVSFIAKIFKVDKEKVKIVRGKTSRKKVIKVEGVEEEDLKRICEEL